MKKIVIFTLLLLAYQSITCMDIFEATKQGNLERVQKLINENHEVVNALTSDNQTPLHYAAIKGVADIAAVLLDHKAAVDARDRCNQTPLHWAAIKGQAAVAIALLNRNAAVDARDNANNTPFNNATNWKRANVEQLLKDWPYYQNAMIHEHPNCLVFLHAQHPRCGVESPARVLSADVFRWICELILLPEHTLEQIHQIAEQERRLQQHNNSDRQTLV